MNPSQLVAGIGIGVQFTTGLAFGLILLPMSLDPDLGRAYQILAENGSTPVPGSLTVAFVLLVTVTGCALLGFRRLDRSSLRGTGRVTATVALASFVIFSAGVAGSAPGALMSFPLADLEARSERQPWIDDLVNVHGVVQWSTLAVALVFGLIATISAAALRSRPDGVAIAPIISRDGHS